MRLKKIIFPIITLLIIICTGAGYYYYKYFILFYGKDILDLKSNNHTLLFYGSRHSNDPDIPMFKQIELYFYKTKPQIVLVEGDFNKLNFTNRDESILKGESAFVTYLAEKNNISVRSVEPSRKEQFDYLLKKYNKDKVMAMYILRQMIQFQREQTTSPKNFKQAVGTFVDGMIKDGFPLSNDESKFDNILNIIKNNLNQEIDDDNWTSIDIDSVVYKNKSEINDIYKEVLNMRNQYLLSTIDTNLKNYDRVFIVMGGDHVIDEKKNIIDIFNQISKQ